MEHLDEKLLQIKYKIKERQRLHNLANKLIGLQRELEIKKNTLHERLRKEELDVEKLEGISISNFIHMIRGDKEDKLEKENQEALTAKLKYDEVCAELDRISKEIIELNNKISEFDDIDSEYNMLIEEKERLMESGQIKTSDELKSIMEQQEMYKFRDKELGEALVAGDELLNSLKQVEDSLKSASNWGMWDMFGGGMISTMAKHSSIDDAKNQIDYTQSLLRRFHREMQDVGGSVEIDIQIGSFLTFADYFFDGLFVDWAVQSKINDAQEKVSDTIYKVAAILLKLEEEQKYVKDKCDALGKKRLEIIEEA